MTVIDGYARSGSELAPDPNGGYVYVFRCRCNSPLYIGYTNNIFKRLGAHFRRAAWIPQTHHVEWFYYANYRQALDVERILIEEEKPLHNVIFLQKQRLGPEQKRRYRAAEHTCIEEASQ